MSIAVFILMLFVYVGAATGYWIGGTAGGAGIGAMAAVILLIGLIAWLGRPPEDAP